MRCADGPINQYKLILAYDGTDFHGWQRQKPVEGQPELRTVQGVLEKALSRLLYQRVVTCGASRTDAGVHAQGQVVAFDAACPIPASRLGHAITGRLPHDMDVRQVALVQKRFDPIRDVIKKQYRFRINCALHRPLSLRNYVCHFPAALDVDRMNRAAALLIGQHDFAGFAAAGHGRKSTVRTIFDCHLKRADEDTIDLFVQGDGFLWNMVRIIAGTLVEVGRGKFEPKRVTEILTATDRSLAGPTLGPQGLILQWIQYKEVLNDQEEEGILKNS